MNANSRPNILRSLRALAPALLLAGFPAGPPGCGLPAAPFPADLLREVGLLAEATAEPAIFITGAVLPPVDAPAGCHAPTITRTTAGTLLTAWYAYEGPRELDGAKLFTAYWQPETAEWSHPLQLVAEMGTVGNPVLATDGDRVWLFFARVAGTGWSTARTFLRTSDDDGASWSPAESLFPRLGTNVRGGPVRLIDGSWLLPAYDDLVQRALFFGRVEGQQWVLRSELPPPTGAGAAIQPTVAVLADGRVLALLRDTAGERLWATVSGDGGRTWTGLVSSGWENPGSPAALLTLASGELLLALNPDKAARRPLAVTYSSDGGQTWTAPRTVVSGTGAYAYPALVQDGAGLIHMVYSHDRRTIGHVIFNLAWVLGGAAGIPE